jgi:hypothetical protein
MCLSFKGACFLSKHLRGSSATLPTGFLSSEDERPPCYMACSQRTRDDESCHTLFRLSLHGV